MDILKRAVVPLFLVLMVCAASMYFYAQEHRAVLAGAKLDKRPTIIVDAGHGELTNTID